MVKVANYKEGKYIDWTNSGSAVSGGVPQLVSGFCAIPQGDIAASADGALQTQGHVKAEKVNTEIVAGATVYYDTDGDPYLGSAGSGCATPTPSEGNFVMGRCLVTADASAKHVILELNRGVVPVPLEFSNGTGAMSGAILAGSGTSSNRTTIATADAKFLSFYLENSVASGDNRGMYLRLYLTGGGGGEALRVFTTIEDVEAGTAHGAHISLSFGASGNITGLGCGLRTTLHIPDGGVAGGTLCALMGELWHDGSSSDISTAQHSILLLANSGDGTGQATVDNVINFVGMNGTMYQTSVSEPSWSGASAIGIRCIVDGAPILLVGTTL